MTEPDHVFIRVGSPAFSAVSSRLDSIASVPAPTAQIMIVLLDCYDPAKIRRKSGKKSGEKVAEMLAFTRKI